MAQQPDRYEDLPEVVQQFYSRKEWLWLSDAEKARLIDTETESEWEEP